MNELKNLVESYESEEFASFVQNFKDKNVEELEAIILDLQSLYQFGDTEGDRGDLISAEDWMVFSHWEPSTQTSFLAYLAIKIAILRN